MNPLPYSNNLSVNLSLKHREVLADLEKKLKAEPNFLIKVCQWMSDKLGNEIVKEIKNLSEENRSEACLEHLLISLASGDVSTTDIKKLLK